MFHHEGRERFPVKQNNLPFNPLNVFFGIFRETRRRNQHPFLRSDSFHAPRKRLHLRAANSSLPSFRLNTDNIQSKLVLFDNPVDPSISGFPDCLPSIFERTTVSHRDEQIDHQLLKEPGRTIADLLQQLISQGRIQFTVTCIDGFFWRPRYIGLVRRCFRNWFSVQKLIEGGVLLQ